MKITVYYTPTCMPCKILDKRLTDLLADHPEVEYNHLNALDYPELGIKGTPHVIIEKDGEVLIEGHTPNIAEVVNTVRDNL